MLRAEIHLFLHIFIPLVVSFFWKKNRLRVFLLLIVTMAIDIDHVLANPIFDPNRCSIGFHPLHSVWASVLWGSFLFFPKLRILGVGLLIHLLLDGVDCIWMMGISPTVF